ncbi:MAG: sigma-70 family RNA polymerase sigma factor [Blastocatellia bacterium]|nr:sigma-70 family RNA polymerase sigma factor [Blastocatellia bacterium]
MIAPDNFDVEKVLVQELRKGNQDAVVVIVRKYQNLVKEYVKNILKIYGLHQQGLENDLAQETLIKFYQNVDKIDFSKCNDLKPWILKIAMNETRNLLREKNIKFISLDGIITDPLEEDKISKLKDIILSYKPTVNNDVNYQESKVLIRQVINTLNSPFKELMTVIVDSDFEITIEELAIIFECSDGTIKSRLVRSRNVLKTILEPLRKWFK